MIPKRVVLLFFRLLAVTAVTATPQYLVAVDASEDARALVQACLDREERVLKGIRWEWTLKRGKCRTADEALAGLFDEQHPVDEFRCRWLSNNGTFLYESVAQQDVRPLAVDAKQRITMTTFGTEIYLATANSRFQLIGSKSGIMQNKAHGFTESWGPGSVPIQSRCFGLGRIPVLRDQIADPQYQVTMESGTTKFDMAARILRINNDDGYEAAYYFRQHGGIILQKDQFYDDVLRSQVVVRESQVVGDREGEIEIPTVIASYHKYSGASSWTTELMTTSSVNTDAVPPGEMAVRLNRVRLDLQPFNRLQEVTFETDLTGENLDDVVEGLLTVFEQRQAPN